MPRALTILLGGAAVVVGVRAIAWLVAPAMLALLVVIAVSPAHRWLRGCGAPPWLATLTVVVLVYGVLTGVRPPARDELAPRVGGRRAGRMR